MKIPDSAVIVKMSEKIKVMNLKYSQGSMAVLQKMANYKETNKSAVKKKKQY